MYVLLLVFDEYPEDIDGLDFETTSMSGIHPDRVLKAQGETAERIVDSCRIEGEERRY